MTARLRSSVSPSLKPSNLPHRGEGSLIKRGGSGAKIPVGGSVFSYGQHDKGVLMIKAH